MPIKHFRAILRVFTATTNIRRPRLRRTRRFLLKEPDYVKICLQNTRKM